MPCAGLTLPAPPPSPQRKRTCGPVLPAASCSRAGGRRAAPRVPGGRSARRCRQHRRRTRRSTNPPRHDETDDVIPPADNSPTRSKRVSISCSGVSQTVSASGMLSRSASVSGRPSSMVKANRPPGLSAPDISSSSVSFSGKASMVSNRSTTSNGPGGDGGIRETSKRQGRSPELSRAMPMALELKSTPR